MTKVIVKRKNGKTTFHFGGKPISIDKAYKLYKKDTKFGMTWLPYLTGRDALQAHSPIPPSPTFIPPEIMSIIIQYTDFEHVNWIKAVVSDDVTKILRYIDTYPHKTLNMKIPKDRFNNPVPRDLTALEYSQLIIEKLLDWKESEEFWQEEQWGGHTPEEFYNNWIEPLNNAIDDWRSIKRKLKKIRNKKGNVSLAWTKKIDWDLVNILGYNTGLDY